MLHFSNVMAQDLKSMYEEYTQTNIQAKADIQKLEARRKELLAITGKDNQKLIKELQDKKSSLEKIKAQQSNSQLDELEKKLHSLQEEKKVLESEIQDLVSEVKQLENDNRSADNTLRTADEKLRKLDELKNNDKASISKDIEDYLKRPFGHMKAEQLNKLKADCIDFKDDATISSCISKIDKTLQGLTIYNAAIGAASGKYVAEKVNGARHNLEAMKAQGLNDAQIKEVNSALQNLGDFRGNYKKGVVAFNNFIQLVKSKNFPSSPSERKNVLEGRLNNNPILRKEIAAYISTNTYLKQLYETYKTAVCQGSSQTVAIEQEIQNIKL